MNKEILKYYSRKDIQKEILKISENREFVPRFTDSFGKRPDVIQYESDVLELAKQGATSFNVSEELWKNPLQLKLGMSKKELDELRAGWDYIIDIDSQNLDYSKILSSLIIDALKFHDINNVSVKFSGNLGFHIAIPFNSFPEKFGNQQTKLLFPEGPRIISSYLKEMIKEHLKNKFLELNEIEDPFKFVNIDTILISSRHLFRSPYSINEKSGLVSIPINPDKISKFDIEQAKIENVNTKIKFLDFNDNKDEAKNLIIQAFDWNLKHKKLEIQGKKEVPKTYEVGNYIVTEELFPPCIKKILEGKLTDGRKRALFILINFMKHMNWNISDIENFIINWNKKSIKPLPESYVKNQINWHKKQKEKRLPPNCSNPSYYENMGIKCSPEICDRCKNPVNYSLIRIKSSTNKNTKSKKK